jgi:hypothetical protein
VRRGSDGNCFANSGLFQHVEGGTAGMQVGAIVYLQQFPAPHDGEDGRALFCEVDVGSAKCLQPGRRWRIIGGTGQVLG